MNNQDSFRRWRPKRKQRDPSETRQYKRISTHKKHLKNQKENQIQPLNSYLNDINCDKLNVDLNSNNLMKLNNIENDSYKSNQIKNVSDNIENAQININEDQVDDAENATLKQKIINLNQNKYVIEEELDDEQLDFDDLGSEYDYNGEDVSSNDENYELNDYPEDSDYEEIDFYRDYEDDFEKSVLKKFENCDFEDDY